MAFDSGPTSFWSWSLRLGAVAGVEVRLHWSLLLYSAFQVGSAAIHGVIWWFLPVLLLVPFVSVLLHEFGHVTATRLCGGSADRIIMWALGGLAMCDVPRSPGRQFFTAAAGPLVNFLIASICLMILGSPPFLDGRAFYGLGLLSSLLAFTAAFNISCLLFNLIPSYPLDGGQMLRAALWPAIGLRRAIITSIYIAYICMAGLFVWAILTNSVNLLLLVVIGVMVVVQEHRMIRQGYDPYTGEVPSTSPGSTWFSRWRRARAAAREQAEADREAREQETLDRLLAKVSAHGLPSLTSAERRELQAISQRQREREAQR